MADEYTINVRHEGRSFRTGVRPDEEVDHLLVKSLNHFGIDAEQKSSWTLARPGSERMEEREPEIVLGDSVADQLEDGSEVELRGRDADAREPATGSY